jgi:hypothetical protein
MVRISAKEFMLLTAGHDGDAVGDACGLVEARLHHKVQPHPSLSLRALYRRPVPRSRERKCDQ